MANRSLACALAVMGAAVASAQSANEIVLHSFIFAPGGAAPCAGVTRDRAGTIYGTTSYGGIGDSGVVYKFDAAVMRQCYTVSRVWHMEAARAAA
jgi:uncharacterized repeat protein (TIGR03803 family)